jgi:hypothetical protein
MRTLGKQKNTHPNEDGPPVQPFTPDKSRPGVAPKASRSPGSPGINPAAGPIAAERGGEPGQGGGKGHNAIDAAIDEGVKEFDDSIARRSKRMKGKK